MRKGAQNVYQPVPLCSWHDHITSTETNLTNTGYLHALRYHDKKDIELESLSCWNYTFLAYILGTIILDDIENNTVLIGNTHAEGHKHVVQF